MKRWKVLSILSVVFALGLIVNARAAGDSRQTSSDFTTVSSSGNVALATSAWTAVPVSPDSGRWGIALTNRSSNNASMLFKTQTDGLAPATTSYGQEIAPGDFVLLSFSGFMKVWMLSLHTATESVFYEELK